MPAPDRDEETILKAEQRNKKKLPVSLFDPKSPFLRPDP
jgi:hypothetical protein